MKADFNSFKQQKNIQVQVRSDHTQLHNASQSYHEQHEQRQQKQEKTIRSILVTNFG